MRDAIVVVVVDIRPKKGRIGFCMRMCLSRSMVREILRKSLFAWVILVCALFANFSNLAVCGCKESGFSVLYKILWMDEYFEKHYYE